MPNLGQNLQVFEPCNLEIWQMTLKNNRASLLCYFKLCASFHRHLWIQTGFTGRTSPIWVKIADYLGCVILKFDRYFKLCASFHRHLWIQTGFIVRTSPIWVKIADYLGCVILKFDRWPRKTIGSASGSRDFTRFGPGGSTLSRFPCKTPIGKVGTCQYTVVTRKLA